MRHINLIQVLILFFITCLFYVDYKSLKRNLAQYYKQFKKTNRKKGV